MIRRQSHEVDDLPGLLQELVQEMDHEQGTLMCASLLGDLGGRSPMERLKMPI